MSHTNNGECPGCQNIFNNYPGFYKPLKDWFEVMQKEHPEFHISDAGRGAKRQEAYFRLGASKAHYGESAHNYNAAIDTFWLIDGKYKLDLSRYKTLIEPFIPVEVVWAQTWKTFRELPHFEVYDWETKAKQGLLKLVEPKP